MKNSLCAHCVLATWMLSIGQSALAVNLTVDPSTLDLGPTQPRDGGPGLAPWVNSTGTNIAYPNEGDGDTLSDYNTNGNALLQPAVIVEDGNELGAASAPSSLFSPATNGDFQSGAPNLGDGRKVLYMLNNNGGINNINEFTTGLNNASDQYMQVNFRIAGSNIPGGMIASLGIAHGPAIGLNVDLVRFSDQNNARRYELTMVQWHGDSSEKALGGMFPAGGNAAHVNSTDTSYIDTFVANPAASGGADVTWHESTWHTIDMRVQRITSDVLGHATVYWDGVLKFDGDLSPWSNGGTPFFDSSYGTGSGIVQFGAEDRILPETQTQGRVNAAFSYVRVSDTPIGAFAPSVYTTNQNLASVHVPDYEKTTLAQNGSPTFNTASPPAYVGSNIHVITQNLEVDGTGKLDVTNNTVVADYTGASSPLAAVTAMIVRGAHVVGGVAQWDGSGISSSTAHNDVMANPSNPLTAIGVLDLGDPSVNPGYDHVNNGEFNIGGPGDPLPVHAVLIKYTYLGDTQLAGKVQFSDFLVWKAAFSANLAGGHMGGWAHAQFDYSEGQTTFADFLIWKNSFSKTLAGLLPTLQSQPISGASSLAAVPEPSSLAMTSVGLVGVVVLRWRCRKLLQRRSYPTRVP